MIRACDGKPPRLGDGVFVAPTASSIDDVVAGARSSLSFGAVPRADDHFIGIGDDLHPGGQSLHEEIAGLEQSAAHYVALASRYLKEIRTPTM